MNLIDFIDLAELKKLAELHRSSSDFRIVQCNDQYHNIIVLGQTNLITSFSGFQISKPMREAAFYFIF